MNSKTYIFSLVIGLLAVFIVYLDSSQCKDKSSKVDKITYIKTFIVGSVLSLLTSLFFCYGGNSCNSTKNYSVKQEILTGNPDF